MFKLSSDRSLEQQEALERLDKTFYIRRDKAVDTLISAYHSDIQVVR